MSTCIWMVKQGVKCIHINSKAIAMPDFKINQWPHFPCNYLKTSRELNIQLYLNELKSPLILPAQSANCNLNILYSLLISLRNTISKRLTWKTIRKLLWSLEITTFYLHLQTYKNPFPWHMGLLGTLDSTDRYCSHAEIQHLPENFGG